MEKERERYRRRLVVVLVPAPLQGHLTPMLQLASILHSKGFSITIAHTLFNSPNPSNHPDFLFLPFSDGLSHTNTYISSHNLATLASTLNTNCVTPLTDLLLLHMTKENIACVIYDGLMYFTDSVAHQLNLPAILLRTTCATNVLAYYHALRHHLQADAFLPFQDEGWSEMVVPNLEPVRFKDLPIFNLPDSDALLKQMNKTVGVTPSLGVILNTLDCLEDQYLDQLRQRYVQVPIFPIGPLHKIAQQDSHSSFLKEDYSCIDWLNKQPPRSVLYLSLGSIASWDQKQLAQMAHGLAHSKQHFLWVVRAGTNINNVAEWVQSLPEDVKKGTEERGCIVRWAPQKEVLAHEAVGGFWSHCGWNSTLESLCEGVPMICQPHFGDQRVNTRLVSHVWKVGLEIEWSYAMEGHKIAKAVRRLLVDEEGKEMWKRAQEMKDEMRLAVRQGGSSYNALDKLVEHILSL